MDYRKALAWYMFHVFHCEGETYVRHGDRGMSCMPQEFRAVLQELDRELMGLNGGRITKPDGTEY